MRLQQLERDEDLSKMNAAMLTERFRKLEEREEELEAHGWELRGRDQSLAEREAKLEERERELDATRKQIAKDAAQKLRAVRDELMQSVAALNEARIERDRALKDLAAQQVNTSLIRERARARAWRWGFAAVLVLFVATAAVAWLSARGISILERAPVARDLSPAAPAASLVVAKEVEIEPALTPREEMVQKPAVIATPARVTERAPRSRSAASSAARKMVVETPRKKQAEPVTVKRRLTDLFSDDSDTVYVQQTPGL